MYMNIDTKMAQAFNRAVTNPDNIQSNGAVNWNYVDADVYMAVGPKTHNNTNTPAELSLINTHYALFDVLCNAYEQANGAQVQLGTGIVS